MSNRLSPEKAKAIAAEYLTNGLNKVQALKSVAYSKNYAEHTGLKLFDNDRVKAEIERMQAITELKTGITVESIQVEHEKYQRLCEKKGDFSTATANLIAKGKTVAAYQDNLNTADTTKAAEIAAMSEKERAALRRIVDVRLQEMAKEA